MKKHFTVSRRKLLGSGAAVIMSAHAPLAAAEAPPYKLSINIEIMFPRNMPRAQRMEAVAAHGMKAFSFWGASEQEQQEMVRVQKQSGLVCASIAGSGSIGRTTGLTKTGYEEAYLDVIRQNCLVARRFGCACMIVFAGQTQKEIPWDRQYAQIVGGLRKAGDIGRDYGVYVCLEPLNRVESPEMTVLTATEGFQIVHDVNHPNVKLCFDMYHLQLSEGNLTNNLKPRAGEQLDLSRPTGRRAWTKGAWHRRGELRKHSSRVAEIGISRISGHRIRHHFHAGIRHGRGTPSGIGELTAVGAYQERIT